MKYYHDAEKDVLIRRDDNGLFVIIPSIPELGDQAAAEPAHKAQQSSSKRRGEPCTGCGSTGTRHFKTCPLLPKNTAKTEDMRAPLTETQYVALRDALHDKDFTSLHYSRDNKLARWEVNQAIKSADYRDYLKSRE